MRTNKKSVEKKHDEKEDISLKIIKESREVLRAHELKMRSLDEKLYKYRRINGLTVLKSGVYEYLGCEIQPATNFELCSDCMYRVVRPEKYLQNKKLIKSFDGVPLIFNQCIRKLHSLKYDENRGIFFQRGGYFGCAVNPRYDNKKKSILVDVVVWDEDIYAELKKQKALKLCGGYSCLYRVYDKFQKFGENKIDFIQIPKIADHVHFAIKIRGDKLHDNEHAGAIPSGEMLGKIDFN